MKTKLPHLLPFLLLLWSCTKSKEPEPTPTCLLVEEVFELKVDTAMLGTGIKSYSTTRRLFYDEKNKLTRMSYEKDGAVLSQLELLYNDKNQLIESVSELSRLVFEYNKQGKIVKRIEFSTKTKSPSSYYDFYYDDKGDLSEAQLISVNSPNWVQSWKYEYVNGNPVTIDAFRLTYDNNPVPNQILQYILFYPTRPPTKNNLLSTFRIGWAETNTINYTYTAHGHPATSSYSSLGIEQLTSYSYQCK